MATVYINPRKGCDYWWLDSSLLTKTKYLGSVSKLTKKQAEEIRLEWEAKEQLAKSGISVIEPAAKTKRVMTYAQFIGEFLKWRKAVYPAGHSQFAMHVQAAMPYFGHLPIADDINTVDRWNDAFNKWQADRVAEVSAQTVKDEWKDIKASLYRAARTGGKKEGNRWNLCQTSPAAELVVAISAKEKARKIKIFTREELAKLYEVNPYHAPFWKFIANTGLRRNEVLNLRKKDVIIKDGRSRVLVDHDLTEGMDTKTGKARSVPLNAEALEAFEEIKAMGLEGDRIFPSWPQDRFSKNFAKDKAAAGIKSGGTFHGLRHTFISDCVNNGVAIHLAMKWAGHTKLETTLRYLDVPDNYEWIEMEKMSAAREEKTADLANVVRLADRRA